MKAALLSTAAALLFAVTTQAQSGVSFSNALVYGSGGYESISVAIADVNADGKPDLLITNLCAGGRCPRSPSHCWFCTAMMLTSCGGASSGGGGGTRNPRAGTYTVTVTGNFTSASANLTHTTKLTLVVQ